MFSEDNNFQREFYQQIPLGVTIEDYSMVKRQVDAIFAEGITDLGQYLKDNPKVFSDMVWEIETIDANESLLKLFKCDNLEQYLKLDNDYEHWIKTDWKEFYLQEIVHFSKGLTYFGDYSDVAANETPLECRCVSWVPSAHKDDWSMVISTHEDITKRKQTERKIIEQRDQLKLLNDQKNEFFAIVAHDLKSPFNALRGFSHLLSETLEKLTPEEIKQYASLINQSSEEAYELVEDLLDWAMVQFDYLEIQPKPYDLKKIIDKNYDRYRTMAKSKNISIKIDAVKDLNIFCDGNMIDAILRNLIVNAIKFTPTSGTITIKTRKNKNTASIKIIDNGVGMSADKINNLFRLDKKVQSRGTEGETGTGIGLHLSCKMAVLNNGKITVESTEGTGTTFTVALPLAQL